MFFRGGKTAGILTVIASLLVTLGLTLPASPSVAAATSGDVASGGLALVYRGPLACKGCAEAASAMMKRAPQKFTVKYIGPKEKLKLTYRNLAKATIYVQPGGDVAVDRAPKLLPRPAKDAIRKYLRKGGVYLGICQGAYLAGRPGLGLLSPGDTGQYIASKGAVLRSERDAVIPVDWQGQRRMIFFQDGPYLIPPSNRPSQILARYTNGKIAAMTTSYGKGTLALVGPHPEAPRSWYVGKLWQQQTNGLDWSPANALIDAALHRG